MSEVVSIPACFDLPETLDCGQAFRWRCIEEDGSLWEGAAFGKALRLRREGDKLLLFCTKEEFQTIWTPYFDLSTDYPRLRESLASIDPLLKDACSFAPGIRLLCQEPWEALCSFLISQNNHIPRIKGIIERLCGEFGSSIPGSELHAFPGPERLASLSLEQLSPLRAGFRAKYLLDAARKVVSGEVDFQAIIREEADFGRQELQKISGVGPKVAECTLLYGFHKTSCFPMDVWMKRVMTKLLPDRTPAEFGEYAGLAQQYLFHYSRMHKELFL